MSICRKPHPPDVSTEEWWLAAGCFEALVDDLRAVLRLAAGRQSEPAGAVIDSRTLRSTPESGERRDRCRHPRP